MIFFRELSFSSSFNLCSFDLVYFYVMQFQISFHFISFLSFYFISYHSISLFFSPYIVSSVIAFLSFPPIPAISSILTCSYVIYLLDAPNKWIHWFAVEVLSQWLPSLNWAFCYSFSSKCVILEDSKYLVIFLLLLF